MGKLMDSIDFEPDEELRKFILEFDATDGRMDWPEDKPLPGTRPAYGGRKPYNKLYAVRNSSLMTQAQLAAKAGSTRRTINAIENGRRQPSVYLAIAIAEALGKKVEDIFHLEPSSHIPPSKY